MATGDPQWFMMNTNTASTATGAVTITGGWATGSTTTDTGMWSDSSNLFNISFNYSAPQEGKQLDLFPDY